MLVVYQYVLPPMFSTSDVMSKYLKGDMLYI